MLRNWIGANDVDAIYVGSNAVDAVYVGAKLIWPLSEEDVFGQVSLISTSELLIDATVELLTSVTLESTTEILCRGRLNYDVTGIVALESTSTFDAGVVQFDMYVNSISEPTFLPATGGTLIVEETSPDYWRVYSYGAITKLGFDWGDPAMRTDVTAVEIIKGDTLLDMEQAFYLLNAMTDFVWNGACNATTMRSCFASATVLVNITVFDTSKVLTFDNCFSRCSALPTLPPFDFSAATNLRYLLNLCVSMVNLPTMNTSACLDFEGMLSGCSSLPSVTPMDTSLGTEFRIMYLNCSSLLCISSVDTTSANPTDGTERMFEGCTLLVSPSILTEQPAILAGSIWEDTNCPLGAPLPPIYEMIEELETDGVYWYLPNSSSSGSLYDGRLEHSSQSTDGAEGSPWLPTNAQYPDDPPPALGWIDLNVNGNATRQINTQWISSQTEAWTLSGIYEVVLGISYKMYTLNYHGDGTVDIYLGQNVGGIETPIELVAENIDYTPPTTTWIITDTPPDIINITIDGIIYEMDSFYTA